MEHINIEDTHLQKASSQWRAVKKKEDTHNKSRIQLVATHVK